MYLGITIYIKYLPFLQVHRQKNRLQVSALPISTPNLKHNHSRPCQKLEMPKM